MAVSNPATPDDFQRVLEIIPQQKPFRFIDEIVELNDQHIVTRYRYREDEYFYQGHFPGRPVTPGVIMIETMAQSAIVAQGLYILMLEGKDASLYTTVFTECEMEFSALVPPGSLVTIRGEKVYHRRNKLKANASVELEDGTVAARGSLAGMGVQL